LEGTIIEVVVNGASHQVAGENAVNQIERMGGILVDYEERQFDSLDLAVDMRVYGPDGELIFDQEDATVSNWFQEGVVKVPLNCDTGESILNDPNIIVYHLDDMDPTEGLATSFEGDHKQASWKSHYAIPGIEPQHGNAIDIGHHSSEDETVTPVCIPEEYPLLGYAAMDEFPPNITELAFGFLPEARAMVQSGDGSYTLTDLDIRYGHISVPHDEFVQRFEDWPNPLPAGTQIGYLRKLGRYNAEIHLGILSPLCYGVPECDAYAPPRDPGALRLPFALFLPRTEYNNILHQLSND
jgi:hypothetical protein